MSIRKSLVAHETNVAFGSLLGVAVLMLVLVTMKIPSSNRSTANILQAVSPSVTVLPEDSLLPEPRRIEWAGYIRRIFVGGEGLEIAGSDAPGGVFQAYASGQLPVFDSQVLIRGIWRGYTCAYGGDNGRCVPEVDIESIAPRPIEFQ